MVVQMVGSVTLLSALSTRPSRQPTPMQYVWLLVRLRVFLVVFVRLLQLGGARARPSLSSCCIPPCARCARRTDSACWSRRGCYDALHSPGWRLVFSQGSNMRCVHFRPQMRWRPSPVRVSEVHHFLLLRLRRTRMPSTVSPPRADLLLYMIL